MAIRFVRVIRFMCNQTFGFNFNDQTAMPNPSLNRTLHSVPAFALAKNASTNTAPLFRAG